MILRNDLSNERLYYIGYEIEYVTGKFVFKLCAHAMWNYRKIKHCQKSLQNER